MPVLDPVANISVGGVGGLASRATMRTTAEGLDRVAHRLGGLGRRPGIGNLTMAGDHRRPINASPAVGLWADRRS